MHNSCGPCWSRKIAWTSDELAELERLDRQAAERKAEEARRAAEAAAIAAQERAAWLASLPPSPPNLKREGISPSVVCEILGCSKSELDRWAKDGRLPADGQRHYHLYNAPVHGRWGRAWLPESVDKAMEYVDEWRRKDRETQRRSVSERALFELVQSLFPDAVSQWSPDWLGRQTVDIYVHSINVAFEYQGEQHYKAVSIFGSEEGLQATQARDARKRERLAGRGVALVEWPFDRPIIEVELERALAYLGVGVGDTLSSVESVGGGSRSSI